MNIKRSPWRPFHLKKQPDESVPEYESWKTYRFDDEGNIVEVVPVVPTTLSPEEEKREWDRVQRYFQKAQAEFEFRERVLRDQFGGSVPSGLNGSNIRITSSERKGLSIAEFLRLEKPE